ncbi:hypothetical protein DM01DRAFT_1340391 [Hesseltinella vesiculosa]|uniref:Anaphase-promoting complex subunit 1 N-terminal domain-containing protein n=1 Tax=Hesseltinella vesiculosa TaxID=101127 RepID=A0A1X2G445_9FUNG|nr:hypothetical protein DM01DRAFT_1340391 [Hesseltinella vesiculosa]
MLKSIGVYHPFGEMYLDRYPHLATAPILSKQADFLKLDSPVKSAPASYVLSAVQLDNQMTPSPGWLEEELYVKGNTVVWSRARQIIKTFQYNSQTVEGVFFANFPSRGAVEKDDAANVFTNKRKQGGLAYNQSLSSAENDDYDPPMKTICIVLKDSLRFHTIDGNSYSIPLPCTIHQILCCDIGILLESKRPNHESNAVFCLNHPCMDFQPISFACSSAIDKLASQELVYATQSPTVKHFPMIIVTRSKAKGMLCVWNFKERQLDHGINDTGDDIGSIIFSPVTKKQKYRSARQTTRSDFRNEFSPKSSPFTRKESFLAASSSFTRDNDTSSSERSINNDDTIHQRQSHVQGNIQLNLLWLESESSTRHLHLCPAYCTPSALIFHDNQGQPTLCVLDNGLLKGININLLFQYKVSGFEISGVKDMMALYNSTRPDQVDLFLVRNDRPMSLLQWLSLDVPLQQIFQVDQEGGISLSDVVGNKFNLTSGGQTKRFQITRRPNQLVGDCLLTLQRICDQKNNNIYYHWVTTFHQDCDSWESFVKSLFTMFPFVMTFGSIDHTSSKYLVWMMQMQDNNLKCDLTISWSLDIVALIMQAFHTLYLEYTLTPFTKESFADDLGSLQWFLARLLKSAPWTQCYKRYQIFDCPDFQFLNSEAFSVPPPFDLRARIAMTAPFADTDQQKSLSPMINRIMEIISQHPLDQDTKKYADWVGWILHADVRRQSLSLMNGPYPALTSLASTLKWLQLNPPLAKTVDFYQFIGRYDMVRQVQLSKGNISGSSVVASSTVKMIQQFSSMWSLKSEAGPTSAFVKGVVHHHAADRFYQILLNLYSYYPPTLLNNLKMVNIILDPSIRQELTVPFRPDLSDQRLAQEHQQIVKQVMQRTVALSLGRAILHYGNHGHSYLNGDKQSLVTIEEKMCHSVKLLPLRTVVQLDEKAFRPEYFHWTRFHQGVASALSLSAPNKTSGSEGNLYWLFYMDPEELDVYHGGLLFGFGLNGHILPILHWYKYITQTRCNLVTIGFLLGACANYRSTKHADLTKILSIHIPSLQMHSMSSPQTPWMVSTCFMGMGLLYMGKNDRMMALVMVKEIGKSVQRYKLQQSTSAAGDTESACALSAGFALGFIVLGKGDIFLSDPSKIVDNLFHYMTGEPLPSNRRSVRSGRKSSGHQFGSKRSPVDLPCDDEETFNDGYEAMQTQRKSDPGISPSDFHVNPTKPSLDITAPAAIIALGLMFLKSENQRVAEKIDFRDTLTRPYLEYIRPDFLLLRVVAKNLILWSSIEPTQLWVELQLPAFMKENDENAWQAWHMQIVNQAKYNIITGACLCLGLRYAGTQDRGALSCLLSYFDLFISLSEGQPTSFQEQITRQTISACLNVLATACSMVVAGSGNPELYNRLKVLHGQTTSSKGTTGAGVNYGHHMATHMALGLLFCGLGRYTLKNDNESVASLLCSFYPFYPTQPDDERYHLQAFRHLWIIAVDQCWITTVDQATREIVQVPLKITYNNQNMARIVSPAIIPDYDQIRTISLDSPDHFPLCLDMQQHRFYEESLRNTGILFVQKKPPQL